MVLIQESCGVWGSLSSHLGCMRMPMSTSSEHMHDPSFPRPGQTYPVNKGGESFTERKFVFSRRGVYRSVFCFAVLAPSW